ncbi:MAG: keto-deoxy-phosphogluconate aldolase, partial [Pseudomonadota bacterium]
MDAGEILAPARVVPVVVLDDAEQAVPLAHTLYSAGLRFVEVTLRTPAALAGIERMTAAVDGLCVGAGSVLNAGQLADAQAAGARFAVSPGSSEALLAAAGRCRLPLVPGAATATEIIALLERGYRLQKFFPA